MLLWIWLAVLLGALVLFLRERYSKFKRAGVNYLPPTLLVGNLLRNLMQKEHLTDITRRIYNAFPNDRFVGHFEFLSPVVTIRDLDLLKKVTLRDFDSFVDHRSFVDEDNDPLFGRNLFAMKGTDWKNMRSTLSPAFTSSKIKLMIPFMVEVGEQMKKSLNQKMKESGNNYIDFEARDLTTRYANDVIASCAFGIKVDSHLERNNEFYTMGAELTKTRFSLLVKFMAYSSCPKLMNFLKINLFPKSLTSYFRILVTRMMKDREEQCIIRPDMIHLLIEAKKGRLIHDDSKSEDAGFATVEESSVGRKKITKAWSEDDLIAQAMLFMFAGFDTVATSMTFLLYELATHKEIQDKLAKEIREFDAKNGGKLDFNSIQNMEYMDMVVSETLRLWTPVAFLDRICAADYNLGKPNDKATKDYILRKGETIFIPTPGLHMDPKYFPNPKNFDPERFSKENRHNILPFSYLPFGLGPRNCIGSRFALCEVKVMTYQLIKDMEIYPCERTSIPPRLKAQSFTLRMKGGHWLGMKPRD